MTENSEVDTLEFYHRDSGVMSSVVEEFAVDPTARPMGDGQARSRISKDIPRSVSFGDGWELNDIKEV